MRNLLDHYLLALRHEAHRSFPADRAEEIVTEIQTHLEDRVETNVRDGISRSMAEADALNDFGPVRKLLHGFLDAAYETPFARRARLISFWLIAILAICLACYRSINTSDPNTRWLFSSYVPTWVFNLITYGILFGIVVLLVGGFLGRRPQTKGYALVWCGAVFLIACQVGTNVANLRDAMPGARAEWGIPATIHRSQLSKEMQISQKHLELAEKEVRLLETGMQTFSQAKWDNAPAEMKAGNGYLVPTKKSPGLRRSAFEHSSGQVFVYLASPYPRYIYLEEQERVRRRHLEVMVNTLQAEQASLQARAVNSSDRTRSAKAKQQIQALEAQRVQLQAQLFTYAPGNYIRNQWMKFGPQWLTAKRKAVEREKWLLSAYASIEQSPSFNIGAVLNRVPLWFLPAIGWLALLLGTDFIAASTGRFFLRLRREWEWRITAARVR